MSEDMQIGKAWSTERVIQETISEMLGEDKALTALHEALAAVSPFNGAFIGQEVIINKLQKAIKEIEE